MLTGGLESTGKLQRAFELSYVYLALLSAAFLVVECLVGGTRLLFSLPAYVLLAVAMLLTIFSTRPSKISASPACLVSSAVFFGYILVRSRWSPVDYLARADFFMALGSLAVYLLTALYIIKPQRRMAFVAVLLAIALGHVAVGLIQFNGAHDFMLFGFQRADYGQRASGQYGCPDHLAGYLEAVAIVGMGLVVWSPWKPWAKILAGYTSLVALAGVLITGSRGGYLSTAFCILVFLALSMAAVKVVFPESFLRIACIGGFLILLISVSLPFLVTSPLLRTRAGRILTKDVRPKMWEAALSQTKLNPLIGTGSGTYLYYGRKFRALEIQNDPVHAHNDYLELLADYGVVGALGFVLFLGIHLQHGFRSFRWIVTKRLQFSADWRSASLALNIGCLSAVAAYLAHSVVDFNLHIPANAMLMAFVFGVLANPGLETFQETGATVKINRLFRVSLPVLGLVILLAGVPKIPGEYFAEKARIALRDKDYFDAVRAAKNGILWEKKNPDLFYYLGESRRSIGDGTQAPKLRKLQESYYLLASDSFKQAVTLFPQDERLLLIEGWTLDALGRRDEAGDFFRRAMEWDPNLEQVWKSYQWHMESPKTIFGTKQNRPAN